MHDRDFGHVDFSYFGRDDVKSLGFLATAWIEHHCIIPDGFRKGKPFTAYDWQFWCNLNHYEVKLDAQPAGEEFTDSDGEIKYRAGASAFRYRRSLIVGSQKALALDTPIATPDGWSTMGDLRVGDVVFDAAGMPTTVLAKSSVWLDDTYRVEFSDKSSLIACGDHEWVVDRRTNSSAYVRERRTTREILAAGIVDGGGARRWRVPMAEPLQASDIDLPIPPYTLGAWLGDGHSDDARITGLDEGVFEQIEADGFRVTRNNIAKRRQIHDLIGLLRHSGVLYNKHIPEMYLRASADQRWALMQGLMDTDGYAGTGKGDCEFTTVLPVLRDGFTELAHSLGLKPVVREGLAKLNGRVTGPKWRISFSARREIPVFRLERKQMALPVSTGRNEQFRHRRITAITPIDPVATQCITVSSPSHTFLAGREMIPTGNSGKGPWSASIVCYEAVGPAIFDGWAESGDEYRCSDHGCPCGWHYTYRPEEPIGKPWPTPLIQLVATAESQVANVYRPLLSMARGKNLAAIMQPTEGFIRLPNDGKIDVVTSSAQSKLGNPIVFALQDETGLYTTTNKMVEVAKTQRRGAAGMGGRSMETSNAYDPTQESTAQATIRSASKRDDIFVFWRRPPDSLGDYGKKTNRRAIHKYAYQGCAHVDLDAIESEAAELLLEDPRNAERFFGNRDVAGSEKWITEQEWDAPYEPDLAIQKGERIALGFDGSDGTSATKRVADSTVLRGCRISDGFRFTIGAWQHEPLPDGEYEPWFVPRQEVMEKIRWAFGHYDVILAGFDPPYWRSEVAQLIEEFGDDRVVEFTTSNDRLMAGALERLKLASLPHDGCPIVREHALNAVTKVKEIRDDVDERKRIILVSKTSKDSPDKIDGLISDAIAVDMRDRAIAAGNRNAPKNLAMSFR